MYTKVPVEQDMKPDPKKMSEKYSDIHFREHIPLVFMCVFMFWSLSAERLDEYENLPGYGNSSLNVGLIF